MREVVCDVEYDDIENEEGIDVPSVILTCTRCGHTTESYGQRGRSVRRCLALMGEECPRGEENYYVTEGVSDE